MLSISHCAVVDMAFRAEGRFMRIRRTRGAGMERWRKVGVAGGWVEVGKVILEM